MRSRDLPQLHGIAPQPVSEARRSVQWEDRFLETDGWEGYEDLAADAADPKWWHVSDEKIAALIAQQQGGLHETRRPSTLLQAGLVEMELAEESVDDMGQVDEPEKPPVQPPKSKTWLVPDDAILKLIQEMEAKQHSAHSALSQTGAELLSMTSPRARPSPKTRDICHLARLSS